MRTCGHLEEEAKTGAEATQQGRHTREAESAWHAAWRWGVAVESSEGSVCEGRE